MALARSLEPFSDRIFSTGKRCLTVNRPFSTLSGQLWQLLLTPSRSKSLNIIRIESEQCDIKDLFNVLCQNVGARQKVLLKKSDTKTRGKRVQIPPPQYLSVVRLELGISLLLVNTKEFLNNRILCLEPFASPLDDT